MSVLTTTEIERRLAAVPATVRQAVALALHEEAERTERRLAAVGDVLRLDGAIDQLANTELVYRLLVRLLAQPDAR